MDFGDILSRAGQIIWKHKVLWLFGILASCGQGGGGGSSGGTNFNVGGTAPNPQTPPGMRRFVFGMQRFFENIEAWQLAAIIIGVFILFIVLVLLTLALQTIGRVGLIQGAALADKGEAHLTIGELFESGKPYFWRVLGLNLLLGLATFAAVMLMIVPMVLIGVVTAGIGFLCLLPLICLLVPLFWAIGIIIEQANIALVLEDQNILEAIQRGWDVFRQNLGNYIVMGLILGIGSAVVGVILVLPLLIVVIPIFTGIILGSQANNDFFFGGGLAVAALCFLAYLPVLIVLRGILRAYIQAAWTLTFQQLTQPPFEGIDAAPPPEPLPA